MSDGYAIKVTYDPEAKVFIAWSDHEELRGLVIEAATPEEIMQEVEDALPFVLEANTKRLSHEPIIASYALAKLSELSA